MKNFFVGFFVMMCTSSSVFANSDLEWGTYDHGYQMFPSNGVECIIRAEKDVLYLSVHDLVESDSAVSREEWVTLINGIATFRIAKVIWDGDRRERLQEKLFKEKCLPHLSGLPSNIVGALRKYK